MWLGEEPADVERLKGLLVPCRSDMSQRVGNVKNNDASLIEPVPINEY